MPVILLNLLWQLADEEARLTGENPSMVFDPIGLLLERPPKRYEYESTPANALTFAHTGGDGVHYSLLDLGEGPSDASPVVMTVPMNPDEPNVIVGRDLHDFLCLGCRTGYFALEQLTYDRSGTVAWLQAPDPSQIEDLWFEGAPSGRQRHLLDLFVRSFRLTPWDGVAEHLDNLQQECAKLILLAPESDG